MSKQTNIRCVVNTITGVGYPWTQLLAGRPHMRAYVGDPNNPPRRLLPGGSEEELRESALNINPAALEVPAKDPDPEPDAGEGEEAGEGSSQLAEMVAAVNALRSKPDVKAFAAQMNIEVNARAKLADMKAAVIKALAPGGNDA